MRSAKAKSMLAPIDEVTGSVVLLDISENATEHITGSIAIPYTNSFSTAHMCDRRLSWQRCWEMPEFPETTRWSSTANACHVEEDPRLRPLSTGS